MKQQATFDDANLILRLYEIRREDRLRAARRWFAQNCGPTTLAEYRAMCLPGTDADDFTRMVVSYYEMVASFVTQGILNAELYFAAGGDRTSRDVPKSRNRWPAICRLLGTASTGKLGRL